MKSEQLKKEINNTNVLLIGDVMLDKYVFGKVTRISPEAPVPIFLSEHHKHVLGGAGNVFNNFFALGVKSTFITIIGKDEAGKEVKKLIRKNNLKNIFIYEDTKKITTKKTRYLANNQQIIRVDHEDKIILSKNAKNFIISNFKKNISSCNVVVISDYDKGVITKPLIETLIKIARDFKKPVIVDPKNKNFAIYKDVYLVTPNQLEASKITGLDCHTNKEVETCANFIIDKYNINNVIVTRGEKGLTFVNKKKIVHSPTRKIEVFDVSGAGDTVLAILATTISSKIEIEDVLFYANKAAGIVVGKIGTSTITKKELFKKDTFHKKDKILNLKELKKRVLEDKEKDLRIGFTNGCFDILHYGHISYLEKSRQLCDKLIVAINSDRSVEKLKGKNRPINNQLSRAKVLAALHFCDYIIIFNEDTPLSLINTLRPDLITKGGDYKIKDVVGSKELLKWGGETKILSYLKKFSTSKIINK